MKDLIDTEEAKLDKFIEDLSKDDLPVPEELESRIVQRINGLKPKRHYGKNIVAAIMAILMLFVAGVKFNPVFASYAAAIPGLKAAVKWLAGDEGIENALQKGYKGMEDITIVEGDYTLLLQNIIMDEDRIYLTAAATGGEITDLLREETSEDPKPRYALSLEVKFTDFENYGALIEGGSMETFAMKVQKIFESGELQSFLRKSPDSLKLEISICKGKETVHSFSPISIPLDKSSFMASKVYSPNEKRSYEHTSITLKQLTVSPTRMRLDLRFDMNEGYTFTGFENPRLEDSKGNVYKPEGLISTQRDTDESSIYFVPSIYFEKLPRHLYFCFDGLRIASGEGRQFKLAMDDIYPKVLEYMGQTITIKQVSWTESHGLTIVSTMPDEKVLKIQNIGGIDYAGASGWGAHDDQLESYLFEIEKREDYQLQFEFAGYFIPADTCWEIPMKP